MQTLVSVMDWCNLVYTYSCQAPNLVKVLLTRLSIKVFNVHNWIMVLINILKLMALITLLDHDFKHLLQQDKIFKLPPLDYSFKTKYINEEIIFGL